MGPLSPGLRIRTDALMFDGSTWVEVAVAVAKSCDEVPVGVGVVDTVSEGSSAESSPVVGSGPDPAGLSSTVTSTPEPVPSPGSDAMSMTPPSRFGAARSPVETLTTGSVGPLFARVTPVA
jgi:hypothetical protein